LKFVNLSSSIKGSSKYEALEADRQTQAAVLYEIIILGEAANCLSPEFRAEYPTVPWKDIIGMWNILAQQYDKVDAEVVWDMIHQDILELMTLLQPLLSTEEDESL
jgi:uncharacterized protein with HEPN domain